MCITILGAIVTLFLSTYKVSANPCGMSVRDDDKEEPSSFFMVTALLCI